MSDWLSEIEEAERRELERLQWEINRPRSPGDPDYHQWLAKQAYKNGEATYYEHLNQIYENTLAYITRAAKITGRSFYCDSRSWFLKDGKEYVSGFTINCDEKGRTGVGRSIRITPYNHWLLLRSYEVFADPNNLSPEFMSAYRLVGQMSPLISEVSQEHIGQWVKWLHTGKL